MHIKFLGILIKAQFGSGIFSTTETGILTPDGRVILTSRDVFPYSQCSVVLGKSLFEGQYIGEAFDGIMVGNVWLNFLTQQGNGRVLFN